MISPLRQYTGHIELNMYLALCNFGTHSSSLDRHTHIRDMKLVRVLHSIWLPTNICELQPNTYHFSLCMTASTLTTRMISSPHRWPRPKARTPYSWTNNHTNQRACNPITQTLVVVVETTQGQTQMAASTRITKTTGWLLFPPISTNFDGWKPVEEHL